MPATRSRTENWYDALTQVAARGGSLEIALKPRGASGGDGGPADIVWRCRLLSVNDREMLIEPPAAVGRSMHLGANVPLVVSMTIGQNRWMFHTTTTGTRPVRTVHGHEAMGVIMALPEHVERCSRRSFFRISTAQLNLPGVQCWPLLDPTSVVAAETANRLQIEDLLRAKKAGKGADVDPILMPVVGPMFPARMQNISGGGLGLVIAPEHTAAADRHAHLWLRVDLTPGVPAPLALTGKRVHTHTDSSQNLYAGVAFEFSYNPPHQRFVMEMLEAAIERLQRNPLASEVA